MKTCSKCEDLKSYDQFYNDKRTKDGKYSACKSCHHLYQSDAALVRLDPNPKRVASYHYKRLASRLNYCKYYRDIKLDLTKQEMVSFVEDNWAYYFNLYQDWKESDFARANSPSLDRIDATKNYSLDNIQFVTTSENCGKDKRGVPLTDEHKTNLSKACSHPKKKRRKRATS